MEVGQSSLLDLLARQDARFAIPAYQRRYAWQQRQCEELWLDVLRAGRRNERHFSGTILYQEKPGEKGVRCLSIVDGQQRMTTVMLMLVALRNHLAEHPGALGGLTAEQVDRLLAGKPAAGEILLVVEPCVSGVPLRGVHRGGKETMVTVKTITEGVNQFIQKGTFGTAVHFFYLTDDFFPPALKEDTAENSHEK